MGKGHYSAELRARGERHGQWKGGRSRRMGYDTIYMPDHPRASKGHVFEHIVIAERALGRPLPAGADVHHAEGKDNHKGLVICPDAAYHKLLHQRARALAACGNANWRRCSYCQRYDDPRNLVLRERAHPPCRASAYHRQCNIDACARRRAARRGQTD